MRRILTAVALLVSMSTSWAGTARFPGGVFFEPNRGQLPKPIEFLSTHARMRIVAEQEGAQLVSRDGRAVLLRFPGSRQDAQWKGEQKLSSTSNYYLGSKERQWTGIPHFAQIRKKNLWDGIDLVFHNRNGEPEFDFVVSPGADTAQIRIQISGGSQKVTLDSGDLVIRVAEGEFRIHKPKTFALAHGRQEERESRYILSGPDEVRLEVVGDSSAGLLIDPVITFSTYLGGDKSENGSGVGQIRTDSAGNIYAAGTSLSKDMPGWPMLRPSGEGTSSDVFLVKTDAAGKLQFVTYFGGSGTDDLYGMAIDDLGRIVVAGDTGSDDLPVKRPLHGKKRAFDGFIARFTSDGELDYSTYFGGSDADYIRAVALDSTRRIVFTGHTGSSDLPIKNALTPTKPTSSSCRFVFLGILETTVSCRNVFVGKLDPDSGELVFSTYLGGSQMNTALPEGDKASAIAVDTLDNIYVAGRTNDLRFPVTNGVIGRTASGSIDGFITKLSPEGGGPFRSTYFGGSGVEFLEAMAVDGDGNPYICGATTSSRIPLANARQSTNRGGTADAFVAKLNEEMTQVIFSTFHGTSGFDICFSLTVAPDGKVVAAGGTDAAGLVLKEPLLARGGDDDGFVVSFDPNGDLLQSSYFGGSKVDTITGMALGARGELYLTGQTNSEDFPLVSPLQSTVAGSFDAFLTAFSAVEGAAETVKFSGNFSRISASERPTDLPRMSATERDDGHIVLRVWDSRSIAQATAQAIQQESTSAGELWLGEAKATVLHIAKVADHWEVVLEKGGLIEGARLLSVRDRDGNVLRIVPVTGEGARQ